MRSCRVATITFGESRQKQKTLYRPYKWLIHFPLFQILQHLCSEHSLFSAEENFWIINGKHVPHMRLKSKLEFVSVNHSNDMHNAATFEKALATAVLLLLYNFSMLSPEILSRYGSFHASLNAYFQKSSQFLLHPGINTTSSCEIA